MRIHIMGMRMAKTLGILLASLAAAGLALASPARAAPAYTPAQIHALFAAAGFPIGPDHHPVNRCGERAT